jgi:phosphate ABC transporter phosphate-binding protein
MSLASTAARLSTLCAALLLACAGPTSLFAQTIHSVFVETGDATPSSRGVEQLLLHRLEKSHVLRIAPDKSSADAVLKVAAVLWPSGTIAPNPRSTNTIVSDYQGYASADLDSRSNQPLWSYLVTPSRFHLAGASADLADQLYENLRTALKNNTLGNPEAASAAVTSGTSLRVAGATFPAPLYRRWFESYAERTNAQPIAYNAIGSSAGLALLAQGKIDLAASDIPDASDTRLMRIPVVIGGVVPIYNLAGQGGELHLTGELLADIYSGTIRTWDDPRLRAENRQLRLPAAAIQVIHRSEGSGTTYVFTSFLATASPGWKDKAGPTIAWPTGTGATGNEGVANAVSNTPNSIGYVELTYAIQHRLSYASVRNPAGLSIRADLSTLTAAAERSAGKPNLLNAPGANSYPIAAFTYLIFNPAANPAQHTALVDLLRWTLTTGQKQCASLGYAPLPKSVADEQLQAIQILK